MFFLSDNPLALEAKPPPESDFIDAFQKFKHAFNLLVRKINKIFIINKWTSVSTNIIDVF